MLQSSQLSYQGPNYRGFAFNLVSSDKTKSPHTLIINTQTIDPSKPWVQQISGCWDGGTRHDIAGSIANEGSSIEFSWSSVDGKNRDGRTNVFTGILTYSRTAGKLVTVFLSGKLTTYDKGGNVLPNKGRCNLSGWGLPPLLTFPWQR